MTLKEVKRSMNKIVLYDGDEYRLVACRLFLHHARPEFCYSAEIVSLRTNTVMDVPLESIQKKEGSL